MQAAFGAVVWIVCGLGLIAGIIALASTGKTWEQYGKNHLLLERDTGPRPGTPATLLERDEEIRQLLEARNLRHARRGQALVDVEQELKRLTAAQMDPGLREEIRDLVIARNHRRARNGKAPLEVEAEIEREIAQLELPGGGPH
ncbi:MAG: hypothetical protein ACYC91_15410 [Solirubrobacteraceae bacterium]